MNFAEYNVKDANLEEILLALKSLDTVEAVALGGSRSTGASDENSDYDIYVYCTEIPTAETRENLRSAIIKNNRNLLNGKLPSYDRQIKKAQERGDIVSVNHRITAFLESYFDVIFALNRQTHPGEKRQVQLCKKYCTLLPKDFEENINALMKSISDGGSYEIVTAMVNNLDEILNDEFK